MSGGLADLVAAGVALANTATDSLQVDLTLERWAGADRYGTATYAAPITVRGLVESSAEPRSATMLQAGRLSGKVATVKATITILNPPAALDVPDRSNPIDDRDRLTLPDGTSDPITGVGGLMRDSGGRYYVEVTVGKAGG